MKLLKNVFSAFCFLNFAFIFSLAEASAQNSGKNSGKALSEKNGNGKNALEKTSAAEGITHSDFMQRVFPDRIYVGDEGELQYQFSSGIDLFADMENAEERPLIAASLPFELETDEWTIKKALVRKSGEDYVVDFIFVPWKPGMLDFPAFDINKAVYGTESIPLMIDPLPLEIAHIVDSDYVELGEPKSPVLFPGTTYAIIGIVLAVILVIVGIVRLVSIRKQIYLWFIEKKAGIKLGSNSRRTKRALKRLLKLHHRKEIEENVFCSEFESILRNYLSDRYGRSFKSVTTSFIAGYVDEITQGCLSENAMSCIEEIQGFFKRCDYIRFAKGSVESRRLPEAMYAASLMNGERKVLVENAIKALSKLENACFEEEKQQKKENKDRKRKDKENNRKNNKGLFGKISGKFRKNKVSEGEKVPESESISESKTENEENRPLETESADASESGGISISSGSDRSDDKA